MIDRSQQLVTVFGGGGFIGRYVCEMLLQRGVRVRVASRNPRAAYFLQPLGGVGQVGLVRTDIGNEASIARAVAGADAVVFLPGVLKGPMRAVHAAGARRVAEAARAAGATALVHVSAIGADAQSESLYGRTKGEGEAAVRAAFPAATIVRPSIVFGPEDGLTNRFAAMGRLPLLPVVAGRSKFQPVYVRDLAEAIARAALEPKRFGGKSFDIVGPQVMTMRALIAAILIASGQSPDLIDVPDPIASLMSRLGFLPGAPLTRDQWLMLQTDNIAASGSLGLEAFGIDPTPLAAVAPEWLDRYRAGGRFAPRRVSVTRAS